MTDLQELLNSLSPDDTVHLTRAQFTTAFGAHGSLEEQRRAAMSLACLYGCDTRFIRERSAFYVVFTRRQV